MAQGRSPTLSRLLNLGCGTDVRIGWENYDLHPEFGAREMDVEGEWPFLSDYFDVIEARDLLEHLDSPTDFICRAHTHLRPGGELRVRGPHYKSRNYATDLTHRRAFSSESFAWAAGNGGWLNTNARPWQSVYTWLTWERPLFFMRLLNLHPALLKVYEATPLSAIPAEHVCAVFRK